MIRRLPGTDEKLPPDKMEDVVRCLSFFCPSTCTEKKPLSRALVLACRSKRLQGADGILVCAMGAVVKRSLMSLVASAVERWAPSAHRRKAQHAKGYDRLVAETSFGLDREEMRALGARVPHRPVSRSCDLGSPHKVVSTSFPIILERAHLSALLPC